MTGKWTDRISTCRLDPCKGLSKNHDDKDHGNNQHLVSVIWRRGPCRQLTGESLTQKGLSFDDDLEEHTWPSRLSKSFSAPTDWEKLQAKMYLKKTILYYHLQMTSWKPDGCVWYDAQTPPLPTLFISSSWWKKHYTLPCLPHSMSRT